jgi:hypothetical protein
LFRKRQPHGEGFAAEHADPKLVRSNPAHERPTLVGKIKIEPAGMLSDAGMDYPLAAIKLRALQPPSL